MRLNPSSFFPIIDSTTGGSRARSVTGTLSGSFLSSATRKRSLRDVGMVRHPMLLVRTLLINQPVTLEPYKSHSWYFHRNHFCLHIDVHESASVVTKSLEHFSKPPLVGMVHHESCCRFFHKILHVVLQRSQEPIEQRI